jgi:hypothetical protein
MQDGQTRLATFETPRFTRLLTMRPGNVHGPITPPSPFAGSSRGIALLPIGACAKHAPCISPRLRRFSSRVAAADRRR